MRKREEKFTAEGAEKRGGEWREERRAWSVLEEQRAGIGGLGDGGWD
jgi:hypothetical protein